MEAATTHALSYPEQLRAQGYVPAQEAADKAGTHISTVYRWMDAGKVTGMLSGRARWVLLTSMEKLLKPKALSGHGAPKLDRSAAPKARRRA